MQNPTLYNYNQAMRDWRNFYNWKIRICLKRDFVYEKEVQKNFLISL